MISLPDIPFKRIYNVILSLAFLVVPQNPYGHEGHRWMKAMIKIMRKLLRSYGINSLYIYITNNYTETKR